MVENVDYRRRFLTISTLHLVGFIVCAAPATVLIILDVIIQIDPDRLEKLRRVFVIVLSGNPLVDSIGFLIVYRGKLRKRRQTRNMELRTRSERPIKRLRDLEVQAQDNHVSLDEEIGGVAVAQDNQVTV